MKRKAWLVLAVIPVLLAAYVVKKSVLPALVSGGEASVGQPRASKAYGERSTGTASGSTAQEWALPASLPADFDPFALLEKHYDAQRTATTARLEEAQASIKARIQPALDASAAKYKLDMETLDRMNLSAEQRNQRTKQRAAEYEKERFDIKRTIQSDLEELKAKGNEALSRLESERSQKRARLQEVQTLVEQGGIDPAAAKQTQFEILGMNLPPAASQPSEERQAPTGAKAAPPNDQIPTVAAIIATADDRFCALVEDALVYEGNTVRGYHVRKIHADSVEFEKDGKTWVQRVD